MDKTRKSRVKLKGHGWRLLGMMLLAAVAVWIDLPHAKPLQIGEWQKALGVKLGLDLIGGSHLTYRANVAGISAEEASEALAGVRDVVERRVNAFGVAEPIVQTSKAGDEWRVLVELAGVHDPDQAIQMIGETPQLDFRREVSEEEALQQFNIDDPQKITGPVFERTKLTGEHLDRSTVTFEQVSGQPQVNLEFDGEGAELFADLTKNNLGKRIAIYLDGIPISAPVVQSEIRDGKAVISGGFTLAEAKELAQRLNAGALPIPIELIGQQTVGPALGRLSIEQSVAAGTVGLVAVMVWMIVFYRLPGLVATVALLFYAILFLAAIKLVGITLTLAGITGFILTIGMAVDANVLIFERFRENLRAGKSLMFSAEEGFKEAWRSIWASNISSLLTAIALYVLGTSLVKGFALTYAIGIILSMFTAVTVSRTLLYLGLKIPGAERPFLLAIKKPLREGL